MLPDYWIERPSVRARRRHRLTINNGCLLLDTGDAYYYFSVSRQALPQRPWRTGYLYLLPADSFVPFLAQIRGHDDERVADYARAVMAAASWPD